MKAILKKTLTLLLVYVCWPFLNLEAKNISITGKYDTIVIQTSAQCGMCKDRIEKALAYEKGVKSSDLDLTTKTVTIIFDPQKTTPEKLRKAIAAVGYDADNEPADKSAYSKLPPCCKKPDDPEAKPH